MSEGGKSGTMEHFLGAAGATMNFEVERGPGVRAAEPEHTFSAEAMDHILHGMALWIGTRVVRAMEAGRPAHHLRVVVRVEVDGEPAR